MSKKVQENLVRLMISGLSQVMKHSYGIGVNGIEEPPVGQELSDFPGMVMFTKFSEELDDPDVARHYFISFMSSAVRYPVDGFDVIADQSEIIVRANGIHTVVAKLVGVPYTMQPNSMELLFTNILKANDNLTNLVDTFKGGKDECRKARP